MTTTTTTSSKNEFLLLPSNFAVVYVCSVHLLASELAQAKFVTPSFKSKWKYQKVAVAVVVYVANRKSVEVFVCAASLSFWNLSFVSLQYIPVSLAISYLRAVVDLALVSGSLIILSFPFRILTPLIMLFKTLARAKEELKCDSITILN